MALRLAQAPNGWFCPDDPGEPHLNTPRWSINATEARILAWLFRGLRVLEIGTGLGISTKAIAATATEVHTVDIDKWVKDNVEIPKNATFYSDIKLVPVELDGAFIDGYHEYNQCRKDIKEAKRIVRKGGLLVFHDTHIEEVFRALRDIHFVEINTSAGMAIGWNE